jgi:hypothetical protein
MHRRYLVCRRLRVKRSGAVKLLNLMGKTGFTGGLKSRQYHEGRVWPIRVTGVS